MSYERTIPVEFNHCDPAGIVFYPRYFEMTNSVVETFFADVAGHSFARMMQDGTGVPTARIEATFSAPSQLGERLAFRLEVMRVGGSSVGLRIIATAGGVLRIAVDLVLVWVKGGRPAPWPEALRATLQAEKAAP